MTIPHFPKADIFINAETGVNFTLRTVYVQIYSTHFSRKRPSIFQMSVRHAVFMKPAQSTWMSPRMKRRRNQNFLSYMRRKNLISNPVALTFYLRNAALLRLVRFHSPSDHSPMWPGEPSFYPHGPTEGVTALSLDDQAGCSSHQRPAGLSVIFTIIWG